MQFRHVPIPLSGCVIIVTWDNKEAKGDIPKLSLNKNGCETNGKSETYGKQNVPIPKRPHTTPILKFPACIRKIFAYINWEFAITPGFCTNCSA